MQEDHAKELNTHKEELDKQLKEFNDKQLIEQ